MSDEEWHTHSERYCKYFIDSLNPDYICKECEQCGERWYRLKPVPPVVDLKELWQQAIPMGK